MLERPWGALRGTRKRTAAALCLVLVGCLAVLRPMGPASADAPTLQHVSVTLDGSSAVTNVGLASMTKNPSGAVTEYSDTIEPQEAVQNLPVRIRTTWSHDGQVGTDLALLAGKSGRFAIQWFIENLTAKPTEVSYESNGVRYSQTELVGVPMTIAAHAEVSGGAVVTAADEQGAVSDGSVLALDSATTSVQWAALLAPPALSPTTSFTLVVDSSDFQVPQLSLSTIAGITTDPSLAGLLRGALDPGTARGVSEQQVLDTVGKATTSLGEAREFVDKVHSALRTDVSTIADGTYADLRSSSNQVASHLRTTGSQLEAIGTSAESAVGGATQGVRGSLRSLVDSFASLLGTNSDPALTPSSVDGCSLTLPGLAEGEERTVSSTFALVNAQMEALGTVLTPSEENDSCRDAIVAGLRASIGDPAVFDGGEQARACEEADASTASLTCALHLLDSDVGQRLQRLNTLAEAAVTGYEGLGTNQLMDVLRGRTGLASQLGRLSERVKALQDADPDAGAARPVNELAADNEAAISAVKSATASLGSASNWLDSVDGVRGALATALNGDGADQGLIAQLDALANSTEGSASVGSWFLSSNTPAAIDSIVGQLDAQGTRCNASWAQGLTSDSSADAIVAALGGLDQQDCPAAQLARSTASMVEGYAATVGAIQSLRASAATARDNAQQMNGQLTALNDAVAKLRASIGSGEELANALYALYDERVSADHPDPTGVLVEVRALLADIRGGVPDQRAQIRQIATIVNGIWPDSSVMPLTNPLECPADDDAGTAPGASGQAVVWLANRSYCSNTDLGAALGSLKSGIDGTSDSSHQLIAQGKDRATGALDGAVNGIDALGSQLQSGIAAQREQSDGATRRMIDEAGARSDERLAQALGDLDTSMNATLTGLRDGLGDAAGQSTTVASSLEHQFEVLLLNLGQPGTNSRLGLIGKLRGITTDIGATGDVLDQSSASVGAVAHSRAAALRRANLRAAAYSLADGRLQEYTPFSGGAGPTTTIITYTIGVSK
ncbi:hypothetical protein HMPREF1317_1656 [Schaalia georgiae F0490]|uniref:Lipoprotein n=1 Tax=Schaalia georgiae F0490 TaxID=1125717 RepID=J0WH26_9ACTO|nr:hypothetical protein [Schaalia georgiae]EJF35871.1 hypothetical protein HMPREF1317_1656 [Schaalia georgiae F0490]